MVCLKYLPLLQQWYQFCVYIHSRSLKKRWASGPKWLLIHGGDWKQRWNVETSSGADRVSGVHRNAGELAPRIVIALLYHVVFFMHLLFWPLLYFVMEALTFFFFSFLPHAHALYKVFVTSSPRRQLWGVLHYCHLRCVDLPPFPRMPRLLLPLHKVHPCIRF